MNIVLDSNVFVSGLVFGGKPDELIKSIIIQKMDGYISEKIVEEVRKTLVHKFGVSNAGLAEVDNILHNAFTLVAIEDITFPVRDPKDRHVLTIAHQVDLDFIISGDKDLLSLKKYKSVPIVTPAYFLDIKKREE